MNFILKQVEKKFIEIIESIAANTGDNVHNVSLSIQTVKNEKGEKAIRVTPYAKGEYQKSQKIKDFI